MTTIDTIKVAAADEGYRACAAGKELVKDNPYPQDHPAHFDWRKGWLEYWKEANG